MTARCGAGRRWKAIVQHAGARTRAVSAVQRHEKSPSSGWDRAGAASKNVVVRGSCLLGRVDSARGWWEGALEEVEQCLAGELAVQSEGGADGLRADVAWGVHSAFCVAMSSPELCRAFSPPPAPTACASSPSTRLQTDQIGRESFRNPEVTSLTGRSRERERSPRPGAQGSGKNHGNPRDVAHAVAAAAVCPFLCFLCGFSRSATAGRCAAGSM